MSRGLVVALATAALVVGAPAPALAQLDPTQPDCEIYEPDPVGRMCKPATQLDVPFVANGVDPDDPAEKIITHCLVSLRNATPPAADGSGRVQFDAFTRCQPALKVVELHSRLRQATNPLGHPVAEAYARCHSDCGYYTATGYRDLYNLQPGEYVQELTVRLVLNEPDGPDPWTEVPKPPVATNPLDTPTPPDFENQGACIEGFLVVRCDLRLPVTVRESVASTVRDATSGWFVQCALHPTEPCHPPNR